MSLVLMLCLISLCVIYSCFHSLCVVGFNLSHLKHTIASEEVSFCCGSNNLSYTFSIFFYLNAWNKSRSYTEFSLPTWVYFQQCLYSITGYLLKTANFHATCMQRHILQNVMCFLLVIQIKFLIKFLSDKSDIVINHTIINYNVRNLFSHLHFLPPSW